MRKDNGLSQEQFAKIINIPYNTYVKYERGVTEPDDAIKMKIAKYFNVSVDYIIGFSNSPRPSIKDDLYIRLPYEFNKKLKSEIEQYIDMVILREKNKKK